MTNDRHTRETIDVAKPQRCMRGGFVSVLMLSTLIALPAHADDTFTGRSDGDTWIGSAWNATPFSLEAPDENAASFRASSHHLQSFARSGMQQKILDAKALAPEGFVMPKLAAPKATALGLWTEIDVNGDGDGTSERRKTAVGADYKLAPSLRTGVAVAQDEAFADHRSSSSVGSFVAFSPFANTTIGTRTTWRETVEADGIATDQTNVQSSVRSQWNFAKMRFTPSLSVSRDVSDDSGTVTFDPSLSRPITLDGGQTLNPFVRYKSESDLSGAATAESVGGGLELKETDGYALSVTTDIESTTETGAEDVKSRVQFKMPLP